ncbi:XkdX family protein [Vermiculatibacterium agrestimuris]|nr:XkdX family protein [Vermiculatibacterium agrestimuris]
MSVLELARKYYPRLWDEKRIRTLGAAGRLTGEEVRQVLQGK